MRILVTGHLGYIGAVLTPLLQRAGHEVVGLDADLYRGCTLGNSGLVGDEPGQRSDIRDIDANDFVGCDAVVHLAALSNDPLGNLDSLLTHDVNLKASIRLGSLARKAGVSRFVFSSSCSVYGAAGADFLDESAMFNPVTPYAHSKVEVEAALAALATDAFAPTYLRNATAYGASPRLRLDLVVNEMVATAVTDGRVVVKSDGTPWRPLVHVEDIARAVLAALEAPTESIANQAFNIGRTSENFRVSEIADMVQMQVPRCRIEYAVGGGPDKRSYRVDFGKAETRLPGFNPAWNLRQGIAQLTDFYRSVGLTSHDVSSGRFVRLTRVRELVEGGELNPSLRWNTVVALR